MKLLKWWKVKLLPRSELISEMSLSKSSAFHSWDSMEELEEPAKLPNSDGLREDGLRNQSSIFWPCYKTLRITPRLSNLIWTSWLLPMFNSTKLRKVEEEPTELMEVLLHTFLILSISNWLPWKRLSRLPSLSKNFKSNLLKRLPRIEESDSLLVETNEFKIFNFSIFCIMN